MEWLIWAALAQLLNSLAVQLLVHTVMGHVITRPWPGPGDSGAEEDSGPYQGVASKTRSL